eukprot:gene12081-12171_t
MNALPVKTRKTIVTTQKVNDPAAVCAVVLGALAMACSPIMQRLADVGPFAGAFWRVTLAIPVLFIWTKIHERGQMQPARPLPLASILAGVMFAGDLFFWHLSVSQTSVANATFFATSAPVWVVIIGFMLWRTKVQGNVLLGLGLCLCGGAALVWQTLSINPKHLIGDANGAMTGVFFGAYFLCVEMARRNGSAARITLEVTVISALLLFIPAFFFEGHMLPHSAYGWTILLGLAWLSHAGGQGLLSFALGRLPAVFSSLVIFLEAVAAAALGWLILGEQLAVVQIMGGVFILAGIWIAKPRQNQIPALKTSEEYALTD